MRQQTPWASIRPGIYEMLTQHHYYFLLSFLLRQFSIAAGTYYHTVSDLKQHKFIILEFWCSKLQIKGFWSKIKALFSLNSSWRLWGRIHFFAFSSIQRLLTFLGLCPPSMYKANYGKLGSYLTPQCCFCCPVSSDSDSLLFFLLLFFVFQKDLFV